MKHWSIKIFLITFTLNAHAAKSIDQFLRQAYDEVNRYSSPAIDSLQNLDNSWIENSEIRYSDDSDRTNKKVIALRLKPKWFSQKSAEDTILNLRQQQRSAMINSTLNGVLEQKYSQLLDLIAEQQLAHKIEQQAALTTDGVKLQHGLVDTKEFSPVILLNSELESSKLGNKAESHRKRLQDMRKRLQLDKLPDNIVTIDDMLDVTTTTSSTIVGDNVAAAKLKLELAQQEHKLNKAKQGIALSHLEFKQEKAYRQEDNFGITVGINIPFGNNYSSSRSGHDVTDAMYNLQLQQQLQQRNAATHREMLHWQKTRADAIKATLNNIDRRIQLAIRNENTELLLALKKHKLKENGKLIDTHHTALRHYIKFLSITGRLSQAPLRNWLVSGQPAL